MARRTTGRAVNDMAIRPKPTDMTKAEAAVFTDAAKDRTPGDTHRHRTRFVSAHVLQAVELVEGG